MDRNIGGVFFGFILLTGLGIYLFNRQLGKASASPLVWTILGCCGLIYLFLVLSIWLLAPGLEAILYVFFTTGAVFVFWLGVLLQLVNQYPKDKNKDKLFLGLMASMVPIFSIIFLWAYINSLGPMKFWG